MTACACPLAPYAAPGVPRIPASAFAAFMGDTATVSSTSRAGASVSATVRARVSDPDADPATVGTSPRSWRWTVEFPRASWPSAELWPGPNSVVAAGPRWPELRVVAAWPLGELWHLECASREAPL